MTMDSWNNTALTEEDRMTLVRECLAAGHRVRYLHFRGVSMRPMLRQGLDAVELAPLPKRLDKYDLPIYQTASGKYVMHRIVKVNDSGYVCRGDNTYHDEHICHGQMLGVVCAFKRGEKRIEVNAPGYRIYCRLWVAIYPLRRLYIRCRNWLSRHIPHS